MGINKVCRVVYNIVKSRYSLLLQVSHNLRRQIRHYTYLTCCSKVCEVLCKYSHKICGFISSMYSTGGSYSHAIHTHTPHQIEATLHIHRSNASPISVCLYTLTHIQIYTNERSPRLVCFEGCTRQRYTHITSEDTILPYTQRAACIWYAIRPYERSGLTRRILFWSATSKTFSFVSQTAKPPSWTHAISTVLLIRHRQNRPRVIQLSYSHQPHYNIYSVHIYTCCFNRHHSVHRALNQQFIEEWRSEAAPKNINTQKPS